MNLFRRGLLLLFVVRDVSLRGGVRDRLGESQIGSEGLTSSLVPLRSNSSMGLIGRGFY